VRLSSALCAIPARRAGVIGKDVLRWAHPNKVFNIDVIIKLLAPFFYTQLVDTVSKDIVSNWQFTCHHRPDEQILICLMNQRRAGDRISDQLSVKAPVFNKDFASVHARNNDSR